MPTLSVAMIVKNEAQDLAKCLDTVKDWVDEIVILDSGSTDETPQIAAQYNAKFYINTDWQGFGKQRQIAQQYVTSDYVLWLDADERVTEELKQSILQAVKNNQQNAVYQINRLSEVFGKQIRHSGWYPDYVVRLYHKGFTSYNDSLVHEKVVLNANACVMKLNGNLLHLPYKDLKHYLVKSINYAELWSMQNKKNTTIPQILLHSIASFFRMYLVKRGLLDGKQGFILAVLSSISVFTKYTMLLLKQKEK